jgi:hypothetical protein
MFIRVPKNSCNLSTISGFDLREFQNATCSLEATGKLYI